MENKYDLIFFDFDDTLFDYEKTEERALREAFSYFGLNYKPDFYNIFKRINRNLWQHHNKNNASGNQILKLKRFQQLLLELKIDFHAEQLSVKYTELSQIGDLIEGVEETIKRLSEDIQLVIISNGPCTPRIEKLANSPIAGKFKFYTSETFDGRFEKPNPDFFREILKNYRNVLKERILVVGDKLSTDILGANKAGLKSVWFPYREHEENCPEAKPDYTINKFNELLTIVYE